MAVDPPTRVKKDSRKDDVAKQVTVLRIQFLIRPGFRRDAGYIGMRPGTVFREGARVAPTLTHSGHRVTVVIVII